MTAKLQNQGFTLGEIITVLIILGVMMTTVVPRLTSAVNRGKNMEAENMLYAIFVAQQDYARENGGAFTALEASLDITIPVMKHFTVEGIHAGTTEDNVPASLGELRFLDSSPPYDLHIDTSGDVHCEIGGVLTAATCIKMGY